MSSRDNVDPNQHPAKSSEAGSSAPPTPADFVNPLLDSNAKELLNNLKPPDNMSAAESRARVVGVLLWIAGLILIVPALAFEFLLLWQFLGQKDSNPPPSEMDSSPPPSDILPPSEFITAISLGTLLIVFGAVIVLLLRMYQYKVWAESVRLHLKNCAEIVETRATKQNSTAGK